MKSFDDILKKGKSAVDGSDPKDIWKSYITNIMHMLHGLNDLYKDKKHHHMAIEPQKCVDCKEATFILAVKDWDNPKQVLRFHRGDWESTDKNKYRCPKCKGKK